MNTILLEADLDYAYNCGVDLGQTPAQAVEARAVLGTLQARLRHIRDRLKPMSDGLAITCGMRAELSLEEELVGGLIRYYETGDV